MYPSLQYFLVQGTGRLNTRSVCVSFSDRFEFAFGKHRLAFFKLAVTYSNAGRSGRFRATSPRKNNQGSPFGNLGCFGAGDGTWTRMLKTQVSEACLSANSNTPAIFSFCPLFLHGKDTRGGAYFSDKSYFSAYSAEVTQRWRYLKPARLPFRHTCKWVLNFEFCALRRGSVTWNQRVCRSATSAF